MPEECSVANKFYIFIPILRFKVSWSFYNISVN